MIFTIEIELSKSQRGLDRASDAEHCYLDDGVGDVYCVMLPPALIEHNPHDDARMVFQLINPSQGFISRRA